MIDASVGTTHEEAEDAKGEAGTAEDEKSKCAEGIIEI